MYTHFTSVSIGSQNIFCQSLPSLKHCCRQAPEVYVLAAKPSKLSWIPGIPMVEAENHFWQVVLLHCALAMESSYTCGPTFPRTHKHVTNWNIVTDQTWAEQGPVQVLLLTWGLGWISKLHHSCLRLTSIHFHLPGQSILANQFQFLLNLTIF